MKLGDGGAKGEGVEAVNKAGGEMTERGFFGMDAEVQKRLEKKRFFFYFFFFRFFTFLTPFPSLVILNE